MEYGDYYGELYGGPLPDNPDHAGTAAIQLTDIARTDGAVAILGAFAERWQRLDFAINNAMPYLLLDYDHASGVWLDAVGEILNVPRDTRSDEYYRRVLAAYAQVIWPRRRTLEGMLEALIRLIGDEAGVSYQSAYPKGFVVELDGLETDEVLTWDAIKILNLCCPATYNRQIVINPDNALLGDDATAAVTITDPLYLDDATNTATITDAGQLAWVI